MSTVKLSAAVNINNRISHLQQFRAIKTEATRKRRRGVRKPHCHILPTDTTIKSYVNVTRCLHPFEANCAGGDYTKLLIYEWNVQDCHVVKISDTTLAHKAIEILMTFFISVVIIKERNDSMHSEGSEFGFRAGQRLSCLRVFIVFLSYSRRDQTVPSNRLIHAHFTFSRIHKAHAPCHSSV
jgi:hypothetical protein